MQRNIKHIKLNLKEEEKKLSVMLISVSFFSSLLNRMTIYNYLVCVEEKKNVLNKKGIALEFSFFHKDNIRMIINICCHF